MKIHYFISVRELMYVPMTQEIMRSRVAQCKTKNVFLVQITKNIEIRLEGTGKE